MRSPWRRAPSRALRAPIGVSVLPLRVDARRVASPGVPKAPEFAGVLTMEPAGIEPATSCLQRNPSERAKWRDLLGIPRLTPLEPGAKARFSCRDFAGRWSTEARAWTSSAATRPPVLLGATDAPGVTASR